MHRPTRAPCLVPIDSLRPVPVGRMRKPRDPTRRPGRGRELLAATLQHREVALPWVGDPKSPRSGQWPGSLGRHHPDRAVARRDLMVEVGVDRAPDQWGSQLACRDRCLRTRWTPEASLHKAGTRLVPDLQVKVNETSTLNTKARLSSLTTRVYDIPTAIRTQRQYCRTGCQELEQLYPGAHEGIHGKKTKNTLDASHTAGRCQGKA